MSSNSTAIPDPSGSGHQQLYGYTPTLFVCVIFIVLFALSAIGHLVQAIYFRLWWLLPTACLAGIGEVIGWSGRLWSSKNPLSLNPYLMQITTTIISPTPLIASNFVILGSIIFILGSQYSRLTPIWYTIVFCTADIVALVVQAVGGAIASEAVENHKDPDTPGGHIMLAGIVIQLVALIIYSSLATEFFIRRWKNRPIPGRASDVRSAKDPELGLNRRLKMMIFALAFNTVCLLIRSIYRTLELANGFSGRIIHTQVLFNVLDGAMITLAITTLNFVHPGVFLIPSLEQANRVRSGSGSDDDTAEKQPPSHSPSPTLKS